MTVEMTKPIPRNVNQSSKERDVWEKNSKNIKMLKITAKPGGEKGTLGS